MTTPSPVEPLTAEQEAEDRAHAERFREAFDVLCASERDFLRYYDETQSLRARIAAVEQDAKTIAKVYVAARLAEMDGLMFGRFCGTIAEMHKRNAAVSEAVSALMSVLFPETTP